MKEIWMVEIEDEHAQFGGTCSIPCVDEESAWYWLYNHLRNLDYLSLLGCKITSLDNIKEESKILEYAAQNNYNSWEYGGRFYITVGKVNVFTYHKSGV